MAIYAPETWLSKTDKELILILSRLLIEHADIISGNQNTPNHHAALSDKESENLLYLLEQLIHSREFEESCYFVEGITETSQSSRNNSREIYLRSRKKRGRSRAMSSIHWAQFMARLGLENEAPRYGQISKMSFSHFRNMEERLLFHLGINPRVVNLIMSLMDLHSLDFEFNKFLEHPTKKEEIKKIVADPIYRIRAHNESNEGSTISFKCIASSIILIADLGILFTTRDWSVAGTISTMIVAGTGAFEKSP